MPPSAWVPLGNGWRDHRMFDDDGRMVKRLTTIGVGWVGPAIGYGVSLLIGLAVSLALFLSGCQDAGMVPVLPFRELCVSGAEREVVVQSATVVMLALMSGGTLLACAAALSHLNRGVHSTLQASALLMTTVLAGTAAILIGAQALPFGGLNPFSLGVACVAGVVCIIVIGPLAAWVAGLIERRRSTA